MSTSTTGPNAPSTAAPSVPPNPWSILLLILGPLLGLVGTGLLAAGAVLSAGSAMQQDNGYFTTQPAPFSTGAYALTSPGVDLDFDPPTVSDGEPFDIATLRFQAAPATPGKDVFIGIAPRSAVEQYLSAVRHSEVREVKTSPFRVEYREVPGTRAPADPASQTFWAASASGPGPQSIEWKPVSGSWSLLVMNADASPGVAVDLTAGLHTDLLGPVSAGVLTTGVLLFLLGAALAVAGAALWGRHQIRNGGGTGTPGGPAPGLYRSPAAALPPGQLPESRPSPVHLLGALDRPLSRWLWLVKWLLAIPHYIVLAFLWFAFAVATVAAGFAILFTGRYPESLFRFNVAVLRWGWRVSFYSYSALGTDRYPPFALVRTDYPADFDVDYPARLSRGLVLVKWWLLAIPHFLIVAALVGTATWPTGVGDWSAEAPQGGISLLGLLVLVAAVVLLFTGRYQRPLFDFIMGINRWVYRVLAYTALMRDEYPPFRLDQGPSEPPGPGVPSAGGGRRTGRGGRRQPPGVNHDGRHPGQCAAPGS